MVQFTEINFYFLLLGYLEDFDVSIGPTKLNFTLTKERTNKLENKQT